MKRIDENHSFSPHIACVVGVEKAIILKDIYYWCLKNSKSNRNYHEGRHWTYNSSSAFSELYPYMNRRSISRWLKELEDDKWIFSGNFNKSSFDQTKWYSINHEKYDSAIESTLAKKEEPIGQNDQSHWPICPDNTISYHTHCNVDEEKSEFRSDCLTSAPAATNRNGSIETPHPLPPPRKKKGKYETQHYRDLYEKYKENSKRVFPYLYAKVKLLNHTEYATLKTLVDTIDTSVARQYIESFTLAQNDLNLKPEVRQRYDTTLERLDTILHGKGLLTLSKIIDHESTTGELPTSYRVDKSAYSVPG